MSKDNLGYYDVYPYKQDEAYGIAVTKAVEQIEDILSNAEAHCIDESDILEALGLRKVVDELDEEDRR